MKIAILGGSFDPVHQGHVQMAYQALDALGMDEVWFLPAYQTPLKDHELTSDAHRVRMLELAIACEDRFRVCTLELERQGKSYTVDTLETLTKQYPDVEFTWLIGNDQLKQFSKWKDPDKLVKLAHFVCFDRDGSLDETIYDIQRIHMPKVPVSSSEIRQGLKLNYVHSDVYQYMLDHSLYIRDFLKPRLKEKRIAHSYSVATLCQEIAKAHQLDTHKAYLIGLFHDIAKSMTKEEMIPWMEILCPEHMELPVAVWHGFVGSEIMKRIFYIYDLEIQEAIYHHVLGSSLNPYAMIVFCADKLDPLRGYDSSETIQVCKEDLYKGFEMVKHQQAKYLSNQGGQ